MNINHYSQNIQSKFKHLFKIINYPNYNTAQKSFYTASSDLRIGYIRRNISEIMYH